MTLEVFRSGKAEIMGNRFGGHRDCARKVNRAGLSELYTAYPSKDLRALEENNPRRRGWFEDVHFGIFIGFDRANPATVDFLTKPASEGGLLDWSFAVPELLKRGSAAKIRDLQLTLVEYLIEFVCDLFLNPKRCVSNSAGFEKFLLEFGGGRNAGEEEHDEE